ncbi:hypothetical protein BGZ95_010889 [Linnemannia exigua]|uniref:F-box domain-containing protein n=1 Tax=Linnemannia exigua TaxID=604196 RepID=A0AAD4DB88_9FUNG|nr:hypothetical protein BGZ95_010889 [Linnemannia exigua]
MAVYSDLPLEVQEKIQARLSQYDLTNCVRVSHAWFTCFNPYLWRSFNLCLRPKKETAQGAAHFKTWIQASDNRGQLALRKYGHLIQELKIRCCSSLVLFVTQDVDGSCCNLRELTFYSGEATMSPVDSNLPPSSAALVQLLQQNKSLKSLTLFAEKGLRIGKKDVFRRYVHCISTWLQWMEALPESLETLTLDTWWSDRTNNFNQEWPTSFPLPVLSRLHSLRFIGVKDRRLNNDPALGLLKVCPNLESLELSVGWNLETTLDEESFVQTLREFCPKLTALKIEGSSSDRHFALLINSCSVQGWKSLTIGEGRPRSWKNSGKAGFGHLASEALLKHAGTLEHVRLQSCDGFNSAAIQQLLCTASQLKRFHAVFGNGTDKVVAPGLSARDLVQSDWVCTELESFACRIYDIPRPDNALPSDANADPTLHSMYESLRVQKQIYERLATLTKLRELVVDLRNQNDRQFGPTMILQNGGFIRDSNELDGLSSSLDSGLDVLKSLAALRTVRIGGLPRGFWEEAEQRWRWKHWPLVRMLPPAEYFEDPVWPPVPDLHLIESTPAVMFPVVYCSGYHDYDTDSESD